MIRHDRSKTYRSIVIMPCNQRVFAAIACVVVGLAAPGSGFGQDIVLDQVVRAGELRLYPSLRTPNVYYYLADQARLTIDENGNPQFSLLRYENGGPDTGGGIFHAVVSLEVTEDQLRDAAQALRRQDPNGTIRGPVPFDGGTFALVTSFNADNGDFTRQVVGLGYAPVLDGQKAAVSIRLTAQGSQVLAASLQMATADLSFSFEMDLSGYRSPIEATVKANIDDIYRDNVFGAAATTPLLAGEIMTEFEKLTQNRSITFEQIGEDTEVEQLAQAAYNKLLDLLFEPTQAAPTPLGQNQTSLLDRATKMLSTARQEVRSENERIRGENERRRREVAAARASAYAGRQAQAKNESRNQDEAPAKNAVDVARAGVYRSVSTASAGVKPPDPAAVPLYISPEDTTMPEPVPEQKLPEYAAVASYRMKRQERSGIFTINLNKQTVETRHLRFDENIGDLSPFASNPAYFRVVDLGDFSIQRRDIRVYVDGLNADQIRQYLNFATVQLRKEHGSGGSVSTDEVRIDADAFSSEGNDFGLQYHRNQEDTSTSDWLSYDYAVTWSFRGHDPVTEKFTDETGNAIALRAPFRVRRVTLDIGDPGLLAERGVRLVTVRIYDPSTGDMLVNESLRPDREPASMIVEFLESVDSDHYLSDISWVTRGGGETSTDKQENAANVIFLDEMP